MLKIEKEKEKETIFMDKFLEKLEPADVIGFFIIVGGFILYAFKVDTVVGAMLTMLTGYYFGHKRKVETKV